MYSSILAQAQLKSTRQFLELTERDKFRRELALCACVAAQQFQWARLIGVRKYHCG